MSTLSKPRPGCEFTKTSDGMMVSCSRGSSRGTCAYCKARPADFRCDYELRGKRAGSTCDGRLCNGCAYSIPGTELHLCPPHRKEAMGKIHDEAAAEASAKAWFDSMSTSEDLDVVDRAALGDMFPRWNEWGQDDSPPVSELAGEIRRRQQADESVTAMINRSGPVTPHDEAVVRGFAQDLVTMKDDSDLRRLMNERIDTHDFDGDCCVRCGMQVMLDGTLETTCGDALEMQTNMYGCRPCPVCDSKKRWPHKTGIIICDDCGHEVPGKRINVDSVVGLCADVWLDDPSRPPVLSRAAAQHAEQRGRHGDGDASLPPTCSRRHHRCSGCGGCAVVARDFPLANDCRPCDWRTCETQKRRLTMTTNTGGRRLPAEPGESPAQAGQRTATIREKVAHVRSAKQTREHTCHWPGCERQVKPAHWGCATHWGLLPRELQQRIWDAYRPGQEETMTPSREYVEAVRAVEAWCHRFNEEERAAGREPRRTSWGEATRRARERDAARVVRCIYCGEPEVPGHGDVCKNHPDPAAQAERNGWDGNEP